MNEERWQHIQDLVLHALDLPPEERRQFIDEACKDDESLLREISSLLDAENEPLSILEEQGEGRLGPMAKPDLPEHIGPYRILRELGRGGMGVVYLAERGDVNKQVALKLIRDDWASPDRRTRFLVERQVLARLDHPAIARFLDAGVMTGPSHTMGRPYVVMEYVDGVPISEYCDRNQLSIKERLRLFQAVGEAVQYAHRNLVVHRDLKPSNVLVSTEGQIKLLDFGIAKLLESESESPLQTRTGARLMTPAYASPEQVRGEAVTTSTDVFSLGIILYELLTGRRPYAESSPTPTLFDSEPQRPSTAVTRTSEADSETIGRARSATIEQLSGQLRGDLDNIILTALRNEPERRYPSAEAFVEDIKRHLKGMPVSARPDTMTYRMQKFVGRHRWGVTMGSVLVALLIGFSITTLWQNRRITQALLQAQQEQDKAEAVSAFMMDLFQANDPAEAQGDSLTAGELMERGLERIEALEAQPEVQTRMLSVIGEINRVLGRYDQADTLLHKAMMMSNETGHERERVHILRHLGRLMQNRNQLAVADSLYRESLAVARRVYGDEHKEVAIGMNNLGLILIDQGKFDEAEPLLRASLDMRRNLLGAAHPEVTTALNNLGQLYSEQQRYEEADSLLKEALVRRREFYGNEHPRVAVTLNNLAGVARQLGRIDEAESLIRESVQLRRKLYGEDHIRVAIGLYGLAGVQRQQGKLEEARTSYEEVLSMTDQLGEEGHLLRSAAMNTLGLMLKEEGNLDEAESYYRAALELRRELYGNRHPRVLTILVNLGRVLELKDDLDETEAVYREALTISRAVYNDPNVSTANALNGLANVLYKKGALNETVPLYRESLELFQALYGEEHIFVATSLYTLANVLRQQGNCAGAEPLFDQAYTIQSKTLADDDTYLALTRIGLGSCLLERKQYEEAEPLLVEGHQVLRQKNGADDADVKRAASDLAELYKATGRAGEASSVSQ